MDRPFGPPHSPGFQALRVHTGRIQVHRGAHYSIHWVFGPLAACLEQVLNRHSCFCSLVCLGGVCGIASPDNSLDFMKSS